MQKIYKFLHDVAKFNRFTVLFCHCDNYYIVTV